jgi:hypothetical protein
MAKAFEGKVPVLDDNLADGIAQGFPDWSPTGEKSWALALSRRPQDRHAQGRRLAERSPRVVILQQAKNKSRSYYKAWDPATSEGERPICASLDGIVPDARRAGENNPISARCCPAQRSGKNDPQTGRRGRECTEYKAGSLFLSCRTRPKPLFGKPILDPDVPAGAAGQPAVARRHGRTPCGTRGFIIRPT